MVKVSQDTKTLNFLNFEKKNKKIKWFGSSVAENFKTESFLSTPIYRKQ